MSPPTVRDILAEQHGGISRAGLLAWCRLRIDPAMTEEQLDVELARLGGEIESDGGFLRLRAGGVAAPASAGAGTVGLPSWQSPAPAGTEPTETRPAADAGSPFEWRPPDLSSGSASAEVPVAGWDAPSGGLSRRSRAALLIGGTIAAIVVYGLAIAIGDANLGETAGSPVPGATLVPGATMIDAYDLAVGDCVMNPASDFTTIEKRPCTAPHEAEVFLVEDMPATPGATFPGEGGFQAFSDERCVAAFETYTGSAYGGQSVLEVNWFSPTEEGWRAGDHEMVCLVTPARGATLDRSWRGGHP